MRVARQSESAQRLIEQAILVSGDCRIAYSIVCIAFHATGLALERLRANGGVEVRVALSTQVIILKRQIANGSVRRADNIGEKRGIAHGIVAESSLVAEERKSPDGAIERAIEFVGSACIKHKRVGSDSSVSCAAHLASDI